MGSKYVEKEDTKRMGQICLGLQNLDQFKAIANNIPEKVRDRIQTIIQRGV